MKPYCEADGVTIYHGDALEVLGVDKPKPVPEGQLDMFGDAA